MLNILDFILFVIVADISSSVFWRTPFSSICSPQQLTEFYVLQIEPVVAKDSNCTKEKFQLADTWIVRSNEVGIDDKQIHTRTHLGHLLHPGDTVLGFANMSCILECSCY